jgi:pyridoxamine 5'-phosphate oxidase-like protein
MPSNHGHSAEQRRRDLVWRVLARRSYCALATSSATNRPHVVGVLYALVEHSFFVATLRGSVKVRNVEGNPTVGVCVPVRRYPVGPPFSVQFQAPAEVLPADESVIGHELERGSLKRITAHGELDHPETCFLRFAAPRRVAVYGLGVPLKALLRDPLAASYSLYLGEG